MSMYIGDEGTQITMDTDVDLTGATLLEIHVRKPNGTRATWPAVQSGSTTMTYITTEGALDIPGRWELAAYAELPAGKWHGSPCTVDVHRVL